MKTMLIDSGDGTVRDKLGVRVLCPIMKEYCVPECICFYLHQEIWIGDERIEESNFRCSYFHRGR